MKSQETINIIKNIDVKAKSFKSYLDKMFGNEDLAYLDLLSQEVDVFIFSGVIRDFLLDIPIKPRDFDFTYRGTLKNKWKIFVLKNFDWVQNSFGGYKLCKDDISCDVWDIDNTFGIGDARSKKKPNDLLDSVFFNFSSIVFDYSSEKFIFDERFTDFMNRRTLEIVNEENPNVPLCFLNIFHYVKTYQFSVGDSVKTWAKQHYHDDLKFTDIQIKHFKRLLYDNTEITHFINSKLLI